MREQRRGSTMHIPRDRFFPYYLLGVLIAFFLVGGWVLCDLSSRSGGIKISYSHHVLEDTPGEFGGVQYDRSQVLLVMEVEITNEGHRRFDLEPESFVVRLGDRTYRPLYGQDDPEKLLPEVLSEGEKSQGRLLFRIPAEDGLEDGSIVLGYDIIAYGEDYQIDWTVRQPDSNRTTAD
ncbi:DUF4352 domain-containing protein [Candidatus Fermentibacteria bacterium]|nr:DUF4352 domain-containing protein [Candidatus Fermentibacteria bacterium]